MPISDKTGRFTFIWALAAIVICTPAAPEVSAQQSPLYDAFELAAGQSENEDGLDGVRQPFADDAEQPEIDDTTEYPPPNGGRLASPNANAVPAQPQGDVPPQRFEGRLPMAGSYMSDDVQMSQSAEGHITLKVRDASLSKVLALLAQAQGLNIVAANDIDAVISITLNEVPIEEALTAILSVANYTWVQRNNIILITSLTDSNLPPGVQGRQIQIFELDFAPASKVAEAVTGFLTPIGKVSFSASDPANNRMARELVVVEDLPESLARIAAYIAQVDCPPRQVLIEAHILQVTLDDTNRQGINLDGLARIANADLTLKTTGFANSAAPQAFLATLEGHDLGSVIELLQTTTDSKTLGSPKLLVLNEQEAKLTVGEKLGYKLTTTPQAGPSQESVQFLDVGVILTVTPRITRDGRVLMHVEPKVSTGDIINDVPNEKTTELYTDLILKDGQGMIIGGLIKETDSVTQSKIPYLGDVKGLGWFFRRTEVTKERVEIIVALVPRIQPYTPEWQAFEQGELVKAGVPLLQGPLLRTHRPWDPVLADGDRVHKPLIPHPHEIRRRWKEGLDAPVYDPWTSQYLVPPHPLPQQRLYGNGCDPTFMPHGAAPWQPGFLSDEEMPLPQAGHDSWNGEQIITDQ